MIVALGETIVALGVGADVGLTIGVATAAVLGIVLVSELWWVYFDVVAIANVRRLVNATPGQVQNAMARDVYSYLHFPLVAGIVIAAFGLHETLAHVKEPLDDVAAFALLGGVAIYLLGHVAVRLRGAHTWNWRRLALAGAAAGAGAACRRAGFVGGPRGGHGAAGGPDRARDADLRPEPHAGSACLLRRGARGRGPSLSQRALCGAFEHPAGERHPRVRHTWRCSKGQA